MKTAVLDSYNNTSRLQSLSVLILPVYRPLCQSCDDNWVHGKVLS